MKIRRCVLWSCLIGLVALAGAAFMPPRAEAGTIIIPAWAFARGNGRIHADPGKFADAGPVVGSGKRQPWGWSIEYDVELPVEGRYTLQICYASAEARPVQVFFDSRNIGKCATRVSVAPASSGQAGQPTWKSSGATWQVLRNRFGGPAAMAPAKNGAAKAGRHTVVLTRRGPLPHLVAIRLDTPAAFPDDWQPPAYKVRDLDSVPAQFRKAFRPASDVDVAALRKPVKLPADPRLGATLTIPAWTFDRGNVRIHAWTFDRGNVRIHASPDQYADAGPVVGGEPIPLSIDLTVVVSADVLIVTC